MPKLFSNLSECLGFSQIITSALFIMSVALSDISCKFPIGVATIYKPKVLLIICFLFTFLISCTPVNLIDQNNKNQTELKDIKEKYEVPENKISTSQEKKVIKKKDLDNISMTRLNKSIIVLLKNNDSKINAQFINVLEVAVFEKNFK